MRLHFSVVRVGRAATTVGLVAAGVIASSAGGAPVASCHGPASQPPNVGAQDGLFGVAVTSACNAWAVGYARKGATLRTLIEHWNGTTWKVQPSPNPGADFDELSGVAATSANNAWTVGHYSASKSERTLIEHWNGKTWKVQPSPDRRSASNLSSVTATSSKNAWAVGSYGTITGPGAKTLIEHWNGKTWKIQPSPNRAGRGSFGANTLSSVAATSATNAWAVGSYHESEKTLIEHWNGKTWKIQTSPSPGRRVTSEFSGVAATSAKNAWAVGDLNAGSQTLVEHWNGNAWKIQSSPNTGSCTGSVDACVLQGVAATSSKSAWAVGSYTNSSQAAQTLVEHWNGKTWKVQPSPSPGSPGPYGNPGNALLGVAANSATNAWAVGGYYNGRAYRNLALRWNGTSWGG